MTRQRTNRSSTIGNDPFAILIPETKEDAKVDAKPSTDNRIPREKLTVHLDGNLINRVKNAAYWNPRLTIAKITERGIRQAIEEFEREHGGAYPQRESELTGGRPMK